MRRNVQLRHAARLVPLVTIAAMLATTALPSHAQGVYASSTYTGTPTDGSGFQVLTFNHNAGNGFTGVYNPGISGRIAVGGTLDQYGLEAGNGLTNSFYPASQQVPNLTQASRADIIVGGQYNAQTGGSGDGGAPNGDVRVGGLFTAGNNASTAPPAVPPAANYVPGSTFDFNNAYTQYLNLSNDLAAQANSTNTDVAYSIDTGGASTGGANDVFTVTAGAGSPSTVFATIDSSNFDSYNTPGNIIGGNVIAAANQTVVVTNTATVVHFYGGGTGNNNSATDMSKVIFNFPNATLVDFYNGGFTGEMLAPKASVSFTNFSFNGSFIVDALNYSGGSGSPAGLSFTGNLPAFNDVMYPTIAAENAPILAPEPSPWASMGLGSLSLLGWALRARRDRCKTCR